MSISAPDTVSLAGLSSGLPAVNPIDVPAAVRSGNAKATTAWDEGLEFEQVLASQLGQQLAATTPSSGSTGASDGSDDSSDGSDSSGGLLGSSAASPYASLIPQALTQGLMSGGGLGVAQEIATAIDPSISDTEAATS